MRYAAFFAIAAIDGTAILSLSWSNIERDNNAFAKDCNDRGGVVKLEFQMRQCIGAAPSSAAGKEGGRMMRALPELKPGQDWCCGGCGSGIVKNPKRIDFEYSREEFPDGRVISMTIPKYVAPCCGEEVMLWDEATQDCIPWSYVDSPAAHEAEALGSKDGGDQS